MDTNEAVGLWQANTQAVRQNQGVEHELKHQQTYRGCN